MLRNSIVVCVNARDGFGYLQEHSVYKVNYVSPCRRFVTLLIRNPKTGNTFSSPLFYSHRFDAIA